MDISNDTTIPYGAELKGILRSSQISESFISKFLQSKGIFTGLRDKSMTIPIVSSCILSPDEFSYISEKKNTVESKTKRRSEPLTWRSTKKVMDVIKDFEIREVAPSEFKSYEFVGAPSFVPQNKDLNDLLLEYKIKRHDYISDDITVQHKEFDGSIRVNKVGNDVKVMVESNFTAKETEEINKKIISYIKGKFRSSGGLDESESRVLFSSFDNENRIKFFWSMTGSISSGLLSFERITDIDVKPDETKDIPKDLDIHWMARKINRMHLSGEGVHEVSFITDTKCYPYLILWNMEALFKFDHHSVSGECKVKFEFPSFVRTEKKDSEFSISVISIKSDSLQSANTKWLEKIILDELDRKKIDSFKSIQENSGAE